MAKEFFAKCGIAYLIKGGGKSSIKRSVLVKIGKVVAINGLSYVFGELRRCAGFKIVIVAIGKLICNVLGLLNSAIKLVTNTLKVNSIALLV